MYKIIIIRRFIEIANIVKQTFETAIITTLYPRSQIDIYLQILQVDGGNPLNIVCLINIIIIIFINIIKFYNY